MAFRNIVARSVICVLVCLLGSASLYAQRFAEPGFRSYRVKAAPDVVEGALRNFLADRIAAGEAVEIISDAKGKQLVVKGSAEIHQLTNQFIQAIDRPASATVAQAPRKVKGYRAVTVEELNARVKRLRQLYGNRADVRIAADERLRQIVVHAPEEVHAQIESSWNDRLATPPANAPATPQRVPVFNTGPRTNQQVKLKNISWQELLRGLRGVQGPNAAVSDSGDGTLRMGLTSRNGEPVQLQIDQQNRAVQISGSEAATKEWTRVVQALDVRRTDPAEQQAVGRLGDAQPTTITRTITMLGGAGGEGGNAAWGGDVVQRMFDGDREPIRVAQLPGNAAGGAQGGGDNAAMVLQGDSTGSFLGPVRIEFLEGTDIFIVRGQKRDVDRVMKIIQDIERLTIDTEPEIEVLELKHANSAAVALLINELNDGPLTARQGDVSVTALVKPNALLLIGREAGVESVKRIVEKLDVPVEPSTQFRVFRLVHLPAVDAERTIGNLYNVLQQQTTTATGEPEPQGLKIRVRAVADFRSNSIVVLGSPRDLAEIGDLLTRIDVEASGTIGEVRVFQLKNALATEVADVLNDTLGTDQSQQIQGGQQQFGGQQGGGAGGLPNTQPFSSRRALMLQMKVLDAAQKQLLDKDLLESGVLTNVVVSSNDRANSIVVVAPQGSMELIAEIIRQLDELPAQEAEIRVFTIVNGDATSLIDMLTTLFEQTDQDDGPLVQSATGTGESTLVPLRFALDARTNSIVASGNPADLLVVQSILLKLDASDVSRRQMMVYELQIQQATSVATAIADFVAQRRAAFQIAPDAINNFDLLDQEVVIVAEPDSNKLIISATDLYFRDIVEVVKELDRRPDMVMVQCVIAEVDLGTAEELGVELGIQDSLLFNRSVGAPPVPGFNFNNFDLGGDLNEPSTARDQVAGQALSNFALGRENTQLGYGGLVLSASNESVSVLIRALQECRRLEVISRPQVMMLNNTTGEVQVGQRVPYVRDQNISAAGIVTNTIEFENVGLILSVLPRISPDGLVVLNVLAERSELNFEDSVPIGPGADVPAIDTTRALTYVTARDGQTVILGGLITKLRQSEERKVPYLGDVPFFGRLFRYDNIVEARSELLVILTPHIIRDESDIDRINSEEYARMSWCLGNVIETHGDIGPVGGMSNVIEQGAVYSELAPAPEEALPPTGVTPAPEAWRPTEPPAEPAPRPTGSSHSRLPQDESLNSPENVSLFPAFRPWKKSAAKPSSPEATGGEIRPVQYQDGAASAAQAKRSVFRFDDVPYRK